MDYLQVDKFLVLILALLNYVLLFQNLGQSDVFFLQKALDLRRRR